MRMSISRVLSGAALLAAAIFVALVASPHAAQAQGPVNFGLRPVGATADDPTAGAYFTYTLEPGASVDGEAEMSNGSDESLSLILFAADGVTSINGSTSFAAADEERTGVRSWLSTNVTEVVLAPGETLSVPFTVQVPPGTPPGDHVAGWVVQGPPKAPSGEGIGATVLERVAVAVVIHVPGPTQEQLVLGAVCLNQETGSNYFEVSVANPGNVMTKGSGTLILSTTDGESVFDLPVDLGTVLPSDFTLLRMDAPLDPGPGDYVAAITLDRPSGQQSQASTEISIAEEKVNGCATVAGAEGGGPDQAGDGARSTDGGLDIPWITVSLILIILLLAIILATREYLNRRRARLAARD